MTRTVSSPSCVSCFRSVHCNARLCNAGQIFAGPARSHAFAIQVNGCLLVSRFTDAGRLVVARRAAAAARSDRRRRSHQIGRCRRPCSTPRRQTQTQRGVHFGRVVEVGDLVSDPLGLTPFSESYVRFRCQTQRVRRHARSRLWSGWMKARSSSLARISPCSQPASV